MGLGAGASEDAVHVLMLVTQPKGVRRTFPSMYHRSVNPQGFLRILPGAAGGQLRLKTSNGRVCLGGGCTPHTSIGHW
jgi:hypothetical protein